MTGPSIQIDALQFIILATVVIVALVFLRRRWKRQAPSAKRQVAALPVRIGAHGGLEILLISTRGSGRWTVPKGWPMRGLSDAEAAVQEAFEEAGVRGTVVTEPIGTFAYVKRRNARQRLLVTVYRLDVSVHVRRWRERGQRTQRWLPASAAANCIAWEGLAEIIRSLEVTSAV